MTRLCLSIIAAAVSCNLALAQNIAVSGSVLDNAGAPVPGVTVIQKDSSYGVVTDADGKYSISVPFDATLVFSCIGFKEVTEVVGGRREISVVLQEDSSMLDESVVIGYGTIRRSTLANSVATVRSEDFVQGSITSPLQVLQGKVAGLAVGTTSGSPSDDGVQMMLRGVSTLECNQEPLIVIDGIIGGSLSNVMPDDIVSIDVLKDGAAAAIYGTKGNNGVILITTRRMKNDGTSAIKYHGYATVESISRKIKVFSAEEYRNLGTITGGKYTPLDMGSNTDWGKEVFRTAFSHYHNISANKSFKNNNFYINAAVNDHYGIMRGSKLTKFNVNAGANLSFFDGKLTIDGNVSNIFAKGTEVDSENAYLGSLTCNPTYPIYTENGDYQFFASVPNAVRSIKEYRTDINWDECSLNGKVTYRPIGCLSLNVVAGMKVFSNFGGTYATRKYDDNQYNGQAWRNTSHRQTNTIEAFAEYSQQIKSHHITAVAGYSYWSYTAQSMSAYNYDFPTDAFGYNNLGLGLALNNGQATMSSNKNMNKLVSFFTRVNYDFDNRVMVSASLRADGSSKFGANHKWGVFWSLSAAYRFNRNFKLRLSYGVTGVEPSSAYLSQLTFNYNTPVYMGGSYIYAIKPTAVANPDLKWEEKNEANLGLDMTFLNGRITATVEGYYRYTKDLLYTYSVPMPPNLASNIHANVGSISNYGVELQINALAVKRKDFTFNVSGNFAFNQNKVISLSNEYYKRDFMELGSTGAPVQKTTHLIKEGGSVGDFYGWKSIGLKANGIWVCEGGSYGTDSARQIIGNGIPKINAALSLTAKYKGFDLSLALRGAFLYEVLNQYRMLWETFQRGQQFNYPKTILDKPYACDVVRTNVSPSYVSYFVEPGDFVKIDNVTFGYNFKFKDKCPVKGLRLYLSGLNLYTFTQYKGIDPEVNFEGLTPGIDYTTNYPTTRRFSFGVKLTL